MFGWSQSKLVTLGMSRLCPCQVNLHPDHLAHLARSYGAGWQTPDVDYWAGARCTTVLGGSCQMYDEAEWKHKGGTPAQPP